MWASQVVLIVKNLPASAGDVRADATAALLQSCPTLCDPMGSSPLGSSVPGILQARILEWVAHKGHRFNPWVIGKIPGARIGNHLQCSCLAEEPGSIVLRITKS